MLRPGFLRTLSDWVSEHYSKHAREMDSAAKEFDLIHVSGRESDPGNALGLFSEWLVFDRKSSLFGGKTGLEYFCAHNPLNVTGEELTAYRDLLHYKVGMFIIQSVDGGRNVTLADMRGNEYVVHDVSASLYLGKGAVWTRIASVAGVYHMVGSLFIPLPFVFGAGFKQMAADWGDKGMDARDAARLLSDSDASDDGHRIIESGALTSEECAHRCAEYRTKFENSLRTCGMQDMFTIEQFEKWLTDERRFPLGFASKALYFLVPEHVSKRERERLFDVSMHFANYLPRPKLKGRCPFEMPRDEVVSDPDHMFEHDVYSREPYLEPLERAHNFMRAHEWRQAYNAFSGVIEDFLKQKIPTTMAFRVFANAAAACFNEGNVRLALAESILLASLRLNPRYDFGLRMKRQELDPLDDFSTLPKGIRKRDIPLIKDMRALVKQGGERQYRRTVFRKYEDFLKKCGISLLSDSTATVTNISNVSGTHLKSPGRNQPCSCGSGKKYKKCCGSPGSAYDR